MTEDFHPHAAEDKPERRSGHSWMMMACCIPMIVIAVLLTVAGVVRPAFLIIAIGCTAMMALMMRGMTNGSGSDSGHNH